MSILLLDNFLDTKFADYFSSYFAEDLIIMRAPENQFPADLEYYSHVILSGSEESILNDAEWIDKEMELVRQLKELGTPTIGLCFGHQLIARALWGKEFVSRSPKPEIGWKNVVVDKQNQLFENLPANFDIYNAHFDQVEVHEEMDILAHSDICKVQAFQVKDAPMWGTQFHPEIDLENGKWFIQDLKVIKPEMTMELEACLLEATEAGVREKILTNFYKVGEG